MILLLEYSRSCSLDNTRFITSRHNYYKYNNENNMMVEKVGQNANHLLNF